MLDHAQAILNYYAGDGWTNMWGRSNIYRNAATSAFDGNMLLHESMGNPGLARRISSGSLMQFLGRDDFLYKGVPALCFSNHEANGETILRTGKVVKNKGDVHGMWNYSKLCFNTKYPWEAIPSVQPEAADGKEACGVECHWMQAVNLADFAVPDGIFRADKLRLHRAPIELTLGSYGFPDNGTEITEKECSEGKAVILKGRDSQGNEKQMAMTIYYGAWKDLRMLHSEGTNPDSEKSIVLYAYGDRKKQYGYEPYILRI